jgi:hypothetical protein
MFDQPTCDHCAGPTKFAAEIQPIGSDPGHRIYYCEACKRLTWTTWRVSQAQQQVLD